MVLYIFLSDLYLSPTHEPGITLATTVEKVKSIKCFLQAALSYMQHHGAV